MNRKQLIGMVGAVIATAAVALQAGSVATPSVELGGSIGAPRPAAPVLIASGLQGASGSTVGPDGALYVTEGAPGRIARVDPETGARTTFASGLPSWVVGLGGAIDVAFIDGTAYALVTLVGPDVGGTNTVGIYRVDGPNTFTIVADIGTFAVLNPPRTQFDVPSGLQFALQKYRGGFLVTDGHHNRVLSATLDGAVSEVIGVSELSVRAGNAKLAR